MSMTRRALGALLLLLASTVLAMETVKVEWRDLLPAEQQAVEDQLLALQQKLWALSDGQREIWYDVAYERSVRTELAAGTLKRAELTAEDKAVLESAPTRDHPEAVSYWDEVDATRAKLNALEGAMSVDLNGKSVRIAGYALPLELSGSSVTEFLLVPYVGACIHAPAPPPNQIVHVHASAPFESKGLFAPVWVEGVMTIEQAKHELSLVDGSAPVNAGYAVASAAVTDYED